MVVILSIVSNTSISLSYGLGRLFGPQGHYKSWSDPSPQLRAPVGWTVIVQRWGKYALLVAYFIPGVRHLAALLTGASGLPLSTFAPFAYCGALLWSTTFIAIGYGLGEEWSRIAPLVHRTVVIVACIVLLAIITGLFIVRRHVRSGQHKEEKPPIKN